ncbi:DUF6262 family protein [Noviherbaspirillum sp. CPCC 100848]|jgi:AcrR family transcriptional regulator|uniref:DUF6262 family protein n=1 Tax=Noviherbaspirillum album TaxID=3080276 RepID=A0ABU6J3V4_9BURK|nr:DUF6262 family protein [Noviherbaspirillum sp. CPCC 100848]MEC4718294.1 DUF6262 family protein [Noviherbaspirillum sp. CPCC 100848]
MNEALDTRAKIVQALEQMIAAGENVSISAVAARTGVSHSLIYNRYPDLKERIKALKVRQKVHQKATNDEEVITRLFAKNKALQERIKSKNNGQVEESFRHLLVHIQQVYSMYDQLLDERNKMAERLSKR